MHHIGDDDAVEDPAHFNVCGAVGARLGGYRLQERGSRVVHFDVVPLNLGGVCWRGHRFVRGGPVAGFQSEIVCVCLPLERPAKTPFTKEPKEDTKFR